MRKNHKLIIDVAANKRTASDGERIPALGQCSIGRAISAGLPSWPSGQWPLAIGHQIDWQISFQLANGTTCKSLHLN